MKRNHYTLVCVAVVMLALTFCVQAQKKAKLGKVCGDPTVACTGRSNFQAWDLPFNAGKNFVIGESEWFYGIVLKSKKLKDYGDCEHPVFSEDERLAAQGLFLRNKVFALNCVESGTNYYNGVAQQTAFIGVYAGPTKAAADAFLTTVQATKQFPGVLIRRMKVGINGT